MNSIFKRLQIIQAALLLEDLALIHSQQAEIDAALTHQSFAHEPHSKIVAIQQALTAKDYPLAQNLITALLAQASALIVRDDHERAALKLQLAALEQHCSELNQTRDEMAASIENFNHTYHLRLGKIIAQILKLQMMIAHFQTIENADDKTQREYEQAKQQYQDFQQQHERELTEPTPIKLDKSEEQRLKKAYHQASRFCHPDMVAEEFKAQATEQFKKLNAAYRQKDLAAVEKTLVALKSGGGFATVSEHIDDKDRLQEQITLLQQRIAELEQEIAALQADEIFQLIESLADETAQESYFQEQKALLEAELAFLQKTFQQLIA